MERANADAAEGEDVSNRVTNDLDQDALSAFKARVAAVRAEKTDPAPKMKRAKRSSKLAQRVRREADASNYGDGRRRARDPETLLVQLNSLVPAEVKEMVQTMAKEDRQGMADIIIQAVYAFHELRQGKVIS